LARNTLESYRRDLLQFAQWLETQGVADLFAVEQSAVQGYLAYKFRSKARASSAARLLSALKRFYRYAVRQGTVQTDPTLRVDAPKLSRQLPKTLTEADVEALLAAPPTDEALGLRDRTMLEVLYASGLRVTELVTLRISGVSEASSCCNSVRVRGQEGIATPASAESTGSFGAELSVVVMQ
jgi:integrase/recombinase XerD